MPDADRDATARPENGEARPHVAPPLHTVNAPKARRADWLAIGMLSFGLVLVLSIAPAAFTYGARPGEVSLMPVPIVIAGLALLLAATQRRHR